MLAFTTDEAHYFRGYKDGLADNIPEEDASPEYFEGYAHALKIKERRTQEKQTPL